jgi:hypothetical protein
MGPPGLVATLTSGGSIAPTKNEITQTAWALAHQSYGHLEDVS